MGNIGEIISLMHMFSPKGQEMALKILKREKQFLASRPSAFAELPSKLAESGELGILEREMNGNSYISENLYYLQRNYLNKINLSSIKSYLSKYQKLCVQVIEIQQKNQIKYITENKLKIIEFIKNECKDEQLAKMLQESKTEDEMQDCFYKLFNEHLKPKVSEENINGMLSKNIEYFKHTYKSLLEHGDLNLKFWKTILPETQDKKILEISNTLKKQYGMKYVYLETLQDAEKMLRAVKWAKNKNIPIPDNAIMTSALPIEGGQNFPNSNLENTVVINSKNRYNIALELLNKNDYLTKRTIKGKGQPPTINELLRIKILLMKAITLSTPHELHYIIHEFEHSRNFMFSNINIPQKYALTVKGLMNYATLNYNVFNDEVRNELLTKRDLIGLNQKEEKLLNLWG